MALEMKDDGGLDQGASCKKEVVTFRMMGDEEWRYWKG
jgi:hypothetical protein